MTEPKFLNNVDLNIKGELMSEVIEHLDENTGEVYYSHYLHDFPNFSSQLLGIATTRQQLKIMIFTHNNLNNLFLKNGRG